VNNGSVDTCAVTPAELPGVPAAGTGTGVKIGGAAGSTEGIARKRAFAASKPSAKAGERIIAVGISLRRVPMVLTFCRKFAPVFPPWPGNRLLMNASEMA
jgi:hypothetical protein